MAFIIRKNSKGDYLKYEKHISLINDGAIKINNPTYDIKNLVCVINHGTHFAAYHVFSKREFERLDAINIRFGLKVWLTYEHAGKLSGFNEWLNGKQ